MVYIVATGKDLERYGFRRYLYGGQEVIVDPGPTLFGQYAVIEGDNALTAQNLVYRLQSGLMGARMFETLSEVDDYVAEDLK